MTTQPEQPTLQFDSENLNDDTQSEPQSALTVVADSKLPAKLEDLSKFVLVGRDKVNSIRAEISALKHIGVLKDVREQKLKEGQAIAGLVLLAESKLGELFSQMQKSSGGDRRSENFKNTAERNFETVESESVAEIKPKLEVAAEMGFNKNQVSQFQKLAENPDAVQKAIETANDNGEIVTRQKALETIKRAEKESRHEELLKQKAYTTPTELPVDNFKLICADIRTGLTEIDDNSVDFIITDPPYVKDTMPLYEDLSKLAARVLKNGGSLIAMTGQSYLPEAIRLLATNLNYHWCMCYLTPGQKPKLWKQQLHTSWKPLLWFVKGKRADNWLGDDVFTSPSADKNFHKWGQSVEGFIPLIERLTKPNDTILDPFLGGGTTAIAALKCQRKFIGADIKQECIDITKKRIVEEFNSQEVK